MAFLFLTSLRTAASPKEITFGIPIGVDKLPSVVEITELVSSALSDIGLKAKPQPLPLQRSTVLVASGELDCALNDDPTLEVGKGKILTTKYPVVYALARIFYRKNDTKFDPLHLEKFNGAFTLNIAAIKKVAEQKKLKFIETESLSQDVQLLVSGHVDYFISIERVGLSILEQKGLTDKIQMAPVLFVKVPIYFSMNKAKYEKQFPEFEQALHKRKRADGPKYKHIKDLIDYE